MTTPTLDRRDTRDTPVLAEDPGHLAVRLAGIAPQTAPVVSCYVRLEPRDRLRHQYHLELKDRIKALELDPVMATLSREDRLSAERDLARIAAWLDRPRALPHARGIAVFASERLDLFDAVPLPRVHRTRVVVDDTPWIAELAAAEREFEPIVAAVIDRAHARFFEVTVGSAAELPGAFSAASRGGKFHSDREDAPGWGEGHYHRRLEEDRHRLYDAVAQRLEALSRSRTIRGFVLAGPADHTAALARFLPERLATRVLGTAAVNPTSVTTAEIQAVAIETADAHDAGALAEELLALDEALGTGWAVNGRPETLRVLYRGQARTLYVQDELEAGGYRCPASGRLVLSRDDCEGEGEPEPVRDLADEAIEEALRQRIRVVMVPRGRSADVVDGLAATLRFR